MDEPRRSSVVGGCAVAAEEYNKDEDRLKIDRHERKTTAYAL